MLAYGKPIVPIFLLLYCVNYFFIRKNIALISKTKREALKQFIKVDFVKQIEAYIIHMKVKASTNLKAKNLKQFITDKNIFLKRLHKKCAEFNMISAHLFICVSFLLFYKSIK